MTVKIRYDEQEKLYLLNIIFITVLVVGNFLSSKLTNFFGLIIPVGTIGYAVTFLVTDIVGELYGKVESENVVRRGFLAIIISLFLARLAIWLPDVTPTPAYSEIFGTATRVMVASISGYLVSQTMDVIIFHRLKQKTKGRFKWLRNNVGTICSQIVDTVVFVLIAFYGIAPNLLAMIVDLIIAKVILALLDTPFFYLFTRKKH